MVSPDLRPWIEQQNNLACFLIKSRKISSFTKVAFNARQGEVPQDSQPTVFDRNHVIYLM